MKLNAGSGGIMRGRYKYPEWINFDWTPSDKIEVRGDLIKLPFKDQSFDEIHLVHVFEHIQRPDQLPVLREMYRVLEPGGSLYVEVPDFKRTIAMLVKAWSLPNNWNYQQVAHNMTASLYGKQRYPGDAHHWAFTLETLREMLEGAEKWSSFEVVPVDTQTNISPHYKLEYVLLVKVTR